MDPDRGRRQRIATPLLALALALVAVWFVWTGGPFAPTSKPNRTEPLAVGTPSLGVPTGRGVSARVGFVGLPPEGATPSTPARGELVLRYVGKRFTHWYEVWVYADGRMIWQREGDLREGANVYATGFLEQRLSHRGVELLLRRGRAGAALFGFPWRPPYPASWLPPSAWADRTIRAYVPSRYAVCYQALRRPVEPSRVFARLPEPAAEILRAGAFDPAPLTGWLDGFAGGCSNVTTADARSIALALEDEGFGQDEEFQQAYGLIYYIDGRGAAGNQIALRFEPMLPHGEVGCSGCG